MVAVRLYIGAIFGKRERVNAASWVLFAGVAGLAVGSFVATLALRWPRGENLGGRSHCDQCGAQLSAIELLPLLGWALRRGRCRHCGGAIDPRHPLSELAGAGIGALAMLAAPGPAGLAGALFGWWLLALILLDLDQHWLPDRLTLPLLALGLWLGQGGWQQRAAGAAAGAALLWLLRAAYRWRRGSDGLGLGDVKLLAALGAWLGAMWLGPLLALAAALGLLLALTGERPLRRDLPVAFGACLAGVAFPLWLLAQTLRPF